MYKHMRKALTALLALLLALSAPALAESLTVSVEKTAGEGENTFTVLDYTFDGRDCASYGKRRRRGTRRCSSPPACSTTTSAP